MVGCELGAPVQGWGGVGGGGRFHTSPSFSDSESWGFSAYRTRLTKSCGAEGSELGACARTTFLLCSTEVKTRPLLSEIDNEETPLC